MQEAINNDTNCMLIISKKDLSNLIYTEVCKALAEHKASFEASSHNTNENTLLTSEEVCKILHTTRQTLCRWDKAKYLCPIKVGAKNMYKAEDINALKK